DYDAMVASFERGEIDAIICWDLDRLTRQPWQLEEWIDRAEEQGLKLVTANGDADLATDGGRMYARIKAAVARGEIERK
ncbi:recombinase family protein, partial [Escherichia coli]|nr:recombinase family protein [Escherichia coli]